jgi:hypothetical protein
VNWQALTQVEALAQVASVGIGAAAYFGLLGSMVALAWRAERDPDVRLGAILLAAILVAVPLALFGWHDSIGR